MLKATLGFTLIEVLISLLLVLLVLLGFVKLELTALRNINLASLVVAASAELSTTCEIILAKVNKYQQQLPVTIRDGLSENYLIYGALTVTGEYPEYKISIDLDNIFADFTHNFSCKIIVTG